LAPPVAGDVWRPLADGLLVGASPLRRYWSPRLARPSRPAGPRAIRLRGRGSRANHLRGACL